MSEVSFTYSESDTTIEERARSLIFQGVGAGSKCWENVGAAGVFDDEQALAVGEALYEALDLLLGFSDPTFPPGRCAICGDPTDHNGEPHAWATGDGQTRASVVADGGVLFEGGVRS